MEHSRTPSRDHSGRSTSNSMVSSCSGRTADAPQEFGPNADRCGWRQRTATGTARSIPPRSGLTDLFNQANAASASPVNAETCATSEGHSAPHPSINSVSLASYSALRPNAYNASASPLTRHSSSPFLNEGLQCSLRFTVEKQSQTEVVVVADVVGAQTQGGAVRGGRLCPIARHRGSCGREGCGRSSSLGRGP